MCVSDIGANLTDGMYQGEYHGSQKHPPDLGAVLERSWGAGLTHIIVTGGSLRDAAEAIKMAKTDGRLLDRLFFSRQPKNSSSFWPKNSRFQKIF